MFELNLKSFKIKIMTNYKKHNQDILDNFDTMTSIAAGKAVNLETDKIHSITFEPFSNTPVQRVYDESNAYQVKSSPDGYKVYIEPMAPHSGSSVVFIQNIEDKSIKTGDKGMVIETHTRRLNKENQATVSINGRDIRVSLKSFIVDPDVKYLYFCKAYQANKSFWADSRNLEKSSHFTEDENVLIATCKYTGELTKEKAAQAKEEFDAIFPLIKKQEEEGKLAILTLSSVPKNPKLKEFKNDCYVTSRKKCFELGGHLKQYIDSNIKTKINIKF